MPGERESFLFPSFLLGSHQTDRLPDEILTEVILPVQEGSSAFLKLGRRKAFTLSVVSAAAFARIRRAKFEEVRVALGAVAPTPIRGRKVEERGKKKRSFGDRFGLMRYA